MPPIRWDYPEVSKDNWRLKVYGLVKNPVYLNWQEFTQLPQEDFTIDFHCVTRWSKLDQSFRGIHLKHIIELVKPTPQAKYIILEGDDGYTTNLSLEEVEKFGDCFIAIQMEGRDIEIKHGGPVRVIVPQLYGWKSAKFLCGIKFSATDEPGYWETRGYHNHGDPWSEERYS